jgi:type I restriction enzyme, S subunit
MVPYLRAANVVDGRLELNDVKEMNFSLAEQRVFALHPGDILVTEGSGSQRAVGASAVWRGEIDGPVCFQNTLLRVRPRTADTDSRFLAWWCRSAFAGGVFASVATGANIFHLSAERIGALPVPCPPIEEQRAIAEFLDAETSRIDGLVAKKRTLIELLEERIDARIRERIADSALVDAAVGTSTVIRNALTKLDRPAAPAGETITAFRDGQVTARSQRRADGYTLAWTDNSNVQGVSKGDLVIHGLDGFAGAIGVCDTDGVCSPVYHVCAPRDGGDPVYIARLLGILAASGYLELFASSTRERAVDFRNWELFGRIPIPRVSPAEQHEVADLIRKIAPLKLAVERSAEYAIEYRQALITSAVAGTTFPDLGTG